MCEVQARCEPLPNGSTCFATALYFADTSYALTQLSHEETNQQLLLLSALQTVPRCWLGVQAFLCAIFVPRCTNNTIVVPTRSQCRTALSECSLFLQANLSLPSNGKLTKALSCDWLPTTCGAESQSATSNWLVSGTNVTNGFCASPLTATQYSGNQLDAVATCAPQCAIGDLRMFDPAALDAFDTLVTICGALTLALLTFSTLVMVAHRCIVQRAAANCGTLNRYLATCCVLFAVATALSIVPSARSGALRTSLACRADDGTLRLEQPRFGADWLAPACFFQFALLYFVLQAACAHLFVVADLVLGLAQRLTAHPRTIDQVRLRRQLYRFAPWLSSAVLTVLALSLFLVDADYVTGLCSVSMRNLGARLGLMIAPLGLLVIATCVQLARTVRLLRASSAVVFSVRLGVCCAGMLLCAVLCLVAHGLEWLQLDAAETPLLSALACGWSAAARAALSTNSAAAASRVSPTMLAQGELNTQLLTMSNTCSLAPSSVAPAAVCLCALYVAACLFVTIFIVGHADFWRFLALLLSDVMHIRLLRLHDGVSGVATKSSRADLISLAYLHARHTRLTPDALRQFAEAERYRERARDEAAMIVRHKRLARHACTITDTFFDTMRRLDHNRANEQTETGPHEPANADNSAASVSDNDIDNMSESEEDSDTDEHFVQTLLPSLLLRRGAIACPGIATENEADGHMEHSHPDTDECDCAHHRNDECDCDIDSALLPDSKPRRRRSRSLTSAFSKLGNVMRRGHSDSFVSSATATASHCCTRNGYQSRCSSSKTQSIESLSIHMTKQKRGRSIYSRSSYSRSVAPRDTFPTAVAWQSVGLHGVPSCRCHLAAAHVMPSHVYVNSAFQPHSAEESETVVDERIDADDASPHDAIQALERAGGVRQSAVSKQSKMSGWSADVSITSLSSSVRYRMLRLAAAASLASPLTTLRAFTTDRQRDTAGNPLPHADSRL